ncbi:MAG: TolC family protein [Puia sp.]|nr:TolC family protein [Puia sp.]
MKKSFMIVLALFIVTAQTKAQTVKLDDILDTIQALNPTLKMYDADIRSMNEAAKGAKAWMAPTLSTGFFMTPYNAGLWRKQGDGAAGMGQYSVAAEQMIPNKSRLDAEYKYMSNMSTVEKEKKGASLNELYANAKRNYYEWLILKMKLSVLDGNDQLLHFMLSNAELRYKNGLEKISAYYKAKAAVGSLESMRLMLQNDIRQKRIALNTLMNLPDKNREYEIDTIYSVKDYSAYVLDSPEFIGSRSDIKAIDREIDLAHLKQNLERRKLQPEFGIRYEHMFGFGGAPDLFTVMGMVRIPLAKWSAGMYKANIEGLKWQAISLDAQKQMMINEFSGMATGMKAAIKVMEKQVLLYRDNIIPALRRNYQTMQLGYEQNTEELFMLYDAWETLNMTQLEYLNQLQQLLIMQTELERILQIK